MVREDIDDISDEEFERRLLPCNKRIIKYIKDEFLNEFIAFDIATYYKMNMMWDESLEILICSAIEDLSQLTINDCDKEKIKKILEEEYKLKVKKENPIDIKEL